MPIPTHRIECTTKAFRTTCQDCNEDVWFFKCSCGSMVFFNALGFPWQIHFCKSAEIRERLELLQDIERYSVDEIYKLITEHEKKYHTEVSDEILEMIENVIGKRKYNFRTETVEVNEELDVVDGKVMEYNREVNLAKRFGYDVSSPFTSGLMGSIGQGQFGEIKIRQNPNNKNISKEFVVIVKKGTKIKKGDFILGNVEVVLHAKGKVWMLTSFNTI